jgi:hypothetical protein
MGVSGMSNNGATPYLVTGINAKTGEQVSEVVDASDKATAKKLAEQAGVVVDKVKVDPGWVEEKRMERMLAWWDDVAAKQRDDHAIRDDAEEGILSKHDRAMIWSAKAMATICLLAGTMCIAPTFVPDYGPYFKSDNAIGATANGIRDLKLAVFAVAGGAFYTASFAGACFVALVRAKAAIRTVGEKLIDRSGDAR